MCVCVLYKLEESQLSKYIDYVYRNNEDISIPYSIYSSAFSNTPIITYSEPLSKILEREKIGTHIHKIGNNSKFDFEAFKENKSWKDLYESI